VPRWLRCKEPLDDLTAIVVAFALLWAAMLSATRAAPAFPSQRHVSGAIVVAPHSRATATAGDAPDSCGPAGGARAEGDRALHGRSASSGGASRRALRPGTTRRALTRLRPSAAGVAPIVGLSRPHVGGRDVCSGSFRAPLRLDEGTARHSLAPQAASDAPLRA
jgi:hypothetical protein